LLISNERNIRCLKKTAATRRTPRRRGFKPNQKSGIRNQESEITNPQLPLCEPVLLCLLMKTEVLGFWMNLEPVPACPAFFLPSFLLFFLFFWLSNDMDFLFL
jgi:hypothetical protein